MAKDKQKKLIVIDGNSLVHRGFHAIPHLSTSKGVPTNGVYGFVMIFLNALKKINPDHIAVTFDLAGGTFRDKIYSQYKAKRIKAPDELYQQIPLVKEFVAALNLPIFEKQGFEADDVIGTIVKRKPDGVRNVIVTGDLDSLQLVDEATTVFTPRKGLTETVEYDVSAVVGRFGFGPEYVVDFKALRGDASDNIPGVRGIGEKGAIDLIKKFGHIEDLYRELEKDTPKARELPPKLREKLLSGRVECFMSKELATININVPVKFDLEKTSFGNYESAKCLKFLQEMEFKSLIAQLPRPKLPPVPHPSTPVAEYQTKHISDSYVLVDTQEKLNKLTASLIRQKEFVFDTETTSQREMDAELLGISCCFREGEAYYIPMLSSSKLGQAVLDTSELKRILQDEKIKKIAHNAKYDYLVLRRAGIQVGGLGFDTMIAAYELNPGSRGFSLDDLAFNRFGYQMLPIEALIGKGKAQISMADVPISDVAQYSCEDADYTFRLKKQLEPELKECGAEKVFFDIDMPLISVLAEMEENGIILDSAGMKKLSKKVDHDLKELEQKIYKQGGGEFNINSPLQMKEVLFIRLGISTLEIKKTKTGLSTAAAELEKMRDKHPIIPLIMEYRELAKLKSTYIDSLPGMVNKSTGRIHTSYNQTIAATGRLSSADPNLQNIPVRTELGNRIRESFIAAPGCLLLSLDYSQIELRVIAHLSDDPVMKKIFKEGKDIHTATAAEMFSVPEEKVSAQERRYAKIINFGILYGLSAHGLTQQVPGIGYEKAQDFIDRYLLAYKKVDAYIKGVIAETKKKGYVENELGRRRLLPEINSSQFQVRSGAERAAMNMPVQSLAADIIKLAMIRIARDIGVQNPDIRMLLQVHDELLFEVKKNKIAEYAWKVKKIMESAYKLDVPLTVETRAGERWGDLKKVGPAAMP